MTKGSRAFGSCPWATESPLTVMNHESKDCSEFPDFFFGSLVVGIFQTGLPPHRDGRYPYEPYRGGGHYLLQESLKRSPGQRCYFRKGKLRHCFTVVGCPEYGILELAEFDTPIADE